MWTQFGEFTLHSWCSVGCIISEEDLIMWQNHLRRSSVGFVKELSLIFSAFFFVFASSFYSFLCLPSPPLHLQACCHQSLLPLISTTTPPESHSSHDGGWRGRWGRVGGCCNCPVYAIPLVLKWQARDIYAILKRGLMNFWHLISCFPVNISWFAGA